MGLTSAITRLADPYDRQARLYPALLAIAPAVLTASSLYGAHASLLTSGAAILASCGIMYWLANLARDRGKTLEPGLFEAWGGKPSVQLLRHRNTQVDAVTKQRYHSALSSGMGIDFPSQASEENDSTRADAIYESATKWLLEKTRDTRHYTLLFKENVSYGFRRNMLGLKPFGVAIALIALAGPLVASGIGQAEDLSVGFNKILTPAYLISIAGSVLLLLLWLTGTTSARVKIVAFAYAERLLAACESVGDAKPTAKRAKKSKSSKI